MKKVLLMAAIASVAAFAQAEMRIGTVDMLKLVRNHTSYDSNKALLEETQNDYQRNIDRLKEEIDSLQEEGKKLMEKARNPMLAAKAKEQLERDLGNVQNKYLVAQQRYRAEALRSEQELAALEARLVNATREDLEKRIAAFAEANGYDLILNVTACPYASPKTDVTAEVLKAMGVEGDRVREWTDEGK